MTAIALKDIPGALVEKKKESKFPYESNIVHMQNLGFNQAIFLQGEVKLTLSREKLAKELFKSRWPTLEWNEPGLGLEAYCYKDANTIIFNLKNLIEVVK